MFKKEKVNYSNSPWAQTQNFTYRYHLGGQVLVAIFLLIYIPRLHFDVITLAEWQLISGNHLLNRLTKYLVDSKGCFLLASVSMSLCPPYDLLITNKDM